MDNGAVEVNCNVNGILFQKDDPMHDKALMSSYIAYSLSVKYPRDLIRNDTHAFISPLALLNLLLLECSLEVGGLKSLFLKLFMVLRLSKFTYLKTEVTRSTGIYT